MPIQILPEPINDSYSYSYNNSYSYSYTYTYTDTPVNTKPYYTKAEIDKKITALNNKVNSLLAKYNKLATNIAIIENRLNKLHEV